VATRETPKRQNARTKSTVLSPLPLPVKTRAALWWKMRVAVKVTISRQGGMEEGSGKS